MVKRGSLFTEICCPIYRARVFWGVCEIPGVLGWFGGEKIKNSRYYLSRLYFASKMFELAEWTVGYNLIYTCREWMRRVGRYHALVCSLKEQYGLSWKMVMEEGKENK